MSIERRSIDYLQAKLEEAKRCKDHDAAAHYSRRLERKSKQRLTGQQAGLSTSDIISRAVALMLNPDPDFTQENIKEYLINDRGLSMQEYDKALLIAANHQQLKAG